MLADDHATGQRIKELLRGMRGENCEVICVARYTIATGDETEHRYALNGFKYLLSLHELDQWCRGHIKYNADGLSEQHLEAFESVRDVMRDYMTQNGVSLEDLT